MKIISGGQTGIDQLALKIAKELEIETAGFCPAKYVTENGPMPNLLKGYGLKPIGSYHNRTLLNIQNSDITLLFGDLNTPGSRAALTELSVNGKRSAINILHPGVLYDILLPYKDGVINVAGNRESLLNSVTRREFISVFTTVLTALKSGVRPGQQALPF